MFHLRIFSALWDEKNSTENLDTPPPLLIHKLFRYRKFSETQHRRIHLRNFSVLWDKTIWQKIVIPAPSRILNIFRYQKFPETQKGSSTKWFSSVRRKTFDGKLWHNPLTQKYFLIPVNNDTLKGSPTKFFGTVRQKTFDGKILHSPQPSHPNFFDTRNYWET